VMVKAIKALSLTTVMRIKRKAMAATRMRIVISFQKDK
jgi:hypothetical protein